MFGLVGVSPAPMVKKDPPAGPRPVGVPAGEAGCVPGMPAALKLKEGAVALEADGVGAPDAPAPKAKGCAELGALAEPNENDGVLFTAAAPAPPKLNAGVVDALPEAPLDDAPNENEGALLPFVLL